MCFAFPPHVSGHTSTPGLASANLSIASEGFPSKSLGTRKNVSAARASSPCPRGKMPVLPVKWGEQDNLRRFLTIIIKSEEKMWPQAFTGKNSLARQSSRPRLLLKRTAKGGCATFSLPGVAGKNRHKSLGCASSGETPASPAHGLSLPTPLTTFRLFARKSFSQQFFLFFLHNNT